MVALQTLLGLELAGVFDAETREAVIEAKVKLGLYASPIVLPYVMRLLAGQK